MNRGEALRARRAAVVPRGVGMMTTATVASGREGIVVDEDGRELVDLATGIGVCATGHCPESVVQAIRQQAGQLLHTCIHVATYEPYVALCERLARLFPHGDETRAMLVNSGAEAVENAIKIARQATGRPAVICFSEGFHGRTLLAATLTSKVGYKTGCGPYAPEIYRLPYPNFFRYGDGLTPERFVARELDRLRGAFTSVVAAEQVAAVILEPVQGEGGFTVAPVEYLQGLRQICDEHGIVLILDEVQSGMGRTGAWAAWMHAGITPDLTTLAKALGAGMPIAAVVGRAAVMDAPRPGTLGGTYGGNPVACAAALANLDLMEALDVPALARSLGERIRGRFESLKARCRYVADVRGLGAMVAMEFVETDASPASALVAEVVASCVERGVLVIPAGAGGNILRILCPLTLSQGVLERALGVLEEEILRAAARRQRQSAGVL